MSVGGPVAKYPRLRRAGWYYLPTVDCSRPVAVLGTSGHETTRSIVCTLALPVPPSPPIPATMPPPDLPRSYQMRLKDFVTKIVNDPRPDKQKIRSTSLSCGGTLTKVHLQYLTGDKDVGRWYAMVRQLFLLYFLFHLYL